MTYKCKLCKENEFETSAGLWKHNNKYHNTNTNTNANYNKTKTINKDKCYLCTYCNKEYKHYQSKWTHEQKCKNIHQPPLTDKVQQLTEKSKN